MSRRSRVLIVDDHPVNIRVIREILGDEYELHEASSGDEALEIAGACHPDLIILDIMMPGISGIEVCQRVRENPVLRHTKILVVSAKALVADRIAAYDHGADDYLTKPFDKQELRSKVRVFLRLKFAEEVSQMKSDVLKLLGHELKTPLNGVIMALELLESNEDVARDERRELTRMASSSVQELNSLCTKILELTQLKSVTWIPTLSDFSLYEIVRSATDDVGSAAATRGVPISLECERDSTIRADSTALHGVLKAILDNALEASEAKAMVSILVSSDQEGASVCVIDRGHGMGRDTLERAFDEFGTVDVSHHSKGHGLSLAISRLILREHGGSLSIDSCAGGGTKVVLRIPTVHSALADSSSPPKVVASPL